MSVIKVPISILEGFCSQGMEALILSCPCASIREKSQLHVSVSLTFSSLALQTKILEGNSLFFSVSKTKTQDLAGTMQKILLLPENSTVLWIVKYDNSSLFPFPQAIQNELG